jgi:hypothetical protein
MVGFFLGRLAERNITIPAAIITAGQKIADPPAATGIQPTFFANQRKPMIAIAAPVMVWPFFLLPF